MSRVFVIFKKELKVSFSSPVAYVILASFTAIFLYLYLSSTLLLGYWNVREAFENIIFIILMFSPVVSMRLIAEERRSKTIELLLSSSITPLQIVLGKYIFSLTIFFMGFVLSLPIAIIADMYINISWIMLFWKYVGLMLFTASLLSIGLMFSSMCENQITAGLLSLCFSLFLYLANLVLPIITNDVLKIFVEEITLLNHYYSFLEGNIDLKDIIYYLFMIIFFLIISERLLHLKR